jgi:hypothetical protein
VLREPSLMRGRGHRVWLLVPFIWQLGLAPLVNDVDVRPLGLPFPMAWQMFGVVLASVCIAVVYRFDRRLERQRNGRDGGS